MGLEPTADHHDAFGQAEQPLLRASRGSRLHPRHRRVTRDGEEGMKNHQGRRRRKRLPARSV